MDSRQSIGKQTLFCHSFIAVILFAFLAESVIAQNMNVTRNKSLDPVMMKTTSEIATTVNNSTESSSQSVKNPIKSDESKKNPQEEAHRRLLAEIVEDLNTWQFSQAMPKFLRIDDNDYQHLVHTVYENPTNKFDILYVFGDSISDTGRKLKFFRFLCEEIAASDFRHMRKLCQFSRSIRKIRDQSTGALAAQAEELLQMLMIAIQKAGAEPISLTFLNNDDWKNMKKVSLDLEKDCSECRFEIYRSVVETVWNKITLDDLLNRAQNVYLKPAKLTIHIAVFEKLERTGALYTNSAIPLAYHMKWATKRGETYSADMDWGTRSEYEKAVDKLPQSVKNAFFSSDICIKNIQYNENLYAGVTPNDVPQNNSDHRVYTSISIADTGEPSKFKWSVDLLPSYQIRFRDVQLNETLYAGTVKYDEQRRYAILLKNGTGNIPVTNGEWQLDVDGNNTRIVNVALKEYLLADIEKTQNGIDRYVFTSIGGKGQAESQWKIEDCSRVWK